MFYCDASLLVAILTPEVHSRVADDWIRQQDAGTLWISPWVTTEIASALAMKQRRGVLTAADRRASIALTQQLTTRTFGLIAVEARHFALAGERMVDTGDGLRAGDALHLAVASDHRLGIATLDLDLEEAARCLDMRVAGLLPRLTAS